MRLFQSFRGRVEQNSEAAITKAECQDTVASDPEGKIFARFLLTPLTFRTVYPLHCHAGEHFDANSYVALFVEKANPVTTHEFPPEALFPFAPSISVEHLRDGLIRKMDECGALPSTDTPEREKALGVMDGNIQQFRQAALKLREAPETARNTTLYARDHAPGGPRTRFVA